VDAPFAPPLIERAVVPEFLLAVPDPAHRPVRDTGDLRRCHPLIVRSIAGAEIVSRIVNPHEVPLIMLRRRSACEFRETLRRGRVVLRNKLLVTRGGRSEICGRVVSSMRLRLRRLLITDRLLRLHCSEWDGTRFPIIGISRP
jgi:hypothetical protein